jgi:hypothetical protein
VSVLQITDHQAAARSRFLQQSVGKPNFQALFDSMTAVVQGFENLSFGVLRGRELGEAVGQQLDGIGQIVGQSRDGQTDDAYRLFIYGRIFANSSDTTTETIIALVTAVFSAKSVQVVSELSPGFSHRKFPGVLGIEIGSPSLDASLWQQAIQVCKASFAAAVRLSWVTVFDVDATFAMNGPVAGAGLDGVTIPMGMATTIYQDAGA